ncbi:MAG: PepSY-associated TM helix domain-containing protein [Bacteroidales bacterium]|jgi:hypothetical protein
MQRKNKLRLWLRRIHRDAGYFAVGITLVYALSGIFLHHKMGVKITTETLQLSPKQESEALKLQWASTVHYKPITYTEERAGEIDFYFPGGTGTYKKKSGATSFETYKDRPLVRFMSQLHENQVKGWGIIADIFACVLIFLAISGLFMVPGKNGFKRRGVWWFTAGIGLVVLFVFV